MQDQELTEMLQVMNQQSLKITEQQDRISDLTSALQEKESQLSEALQIAEDLKAQTPDLAFLLKENQNLKQRLKESDLRTELLLADTRKEYELKVQQLLNEKRILESSLKNIPSKPVKGHINSKIIVLLVVVGITEIIYGIWLWAYVA